MRRRRLIRHHGSDRLPEPPLHAPRGSRTTRRPYWCDRDSAEIGQSQRPKPYSNKRTPARQWKPSPLADANAPPSVFTAVTISNSPVTAPASGWIPCARWNSIWRRSRRARVFSAANRWTSTPALPDYTSSTIANKPIVHLLKEIAKRPTASRVFISNGDVLVELRR